MDILRGKRFIKFLRCFLPLLFILFFGGITLFNHSHVVNGVIIVHSHPYSVKHNHTVNEFETIFFLSIIHTFGELSPSLSPVLWLSLICVMPIVALYNRPVSIMQGVKSLRAPPAILDSKLYI